jgi:c(7)-type cytochrome triheme protein
MTTATSTDDFSPPRRTAPGWRRWSTAAALMIMLLLGVGWPGDAGAEYGDVVINQRSDFEGMRPVVFPHWFHRIRFRCKVCHTELGFKMRAGANQVLMTDIIDGKFCGMCHNNQIAWGPERCELCHSGLPGLSPGIVGGAQTSGPGRW